MDTFFYIIIPQEFAEDMAGTESTVKPGSFFGYAVTIDGRYVCSANSLDDFPNQFAELGEMTVVSLGSSDFPPTPPIE